MLQQRCIGRQLTPRALNFARISTNINKSPSVPFHGAYIHSGLSSYSRIRATSAWPLVAFCSLRFVRWLGFTYG